VTDAAGRSQTHGSGDRDGSARPGGAHGEGEGNGAGLARPASPSGEIGAGPGSSSGAVGPGERGEGDGDGAELARSVSPSGGAELARPASPSGGVERGAGLVRPASSSGGGGDGAELARSASSSDGPLDGSGVSSPPFEGADLDDEFVESAPYRPFWARTSTLVVFVVVLFVLSGAVTAWLWISDLQDQLDTLHAQTFAVEEARLAAIPLAEDLATYDYRDLEGNFSRVKAAATPHFAGQLRQLTEELGPRLQQGRAMATGKVLSAGVVRATPSVVVVALFVDQTVTNTLAPTPRTEHSRMELTLVRQGGAWRLDQAGEL
jgi:Mce-associated membrane protein